MTVVDTSGWLEFFASGERMAGFAGLMERPDQILTPTIVVYEVCRKTIRERGAEDAQVALALMRKTRIVPLTDGLAVRAAEVAQQHRLAMADAIVYATALAHDAEVLTLDSDFEDLPHATVVKG